LPILLFQFFPLLFVVQLRDPPILLISRPKDSFSLEVQEQKQIQEQNKLQEQKPFPSKGNDSIPGDKPISKTEEAAALPAVALTSMTDEEFGAYLRRDKPEPLTKLQLMGREFADAEKEIAALREND